MFDKQPMEGEALSGHPLSAYRQILQKEFTCQQSLPCEFHPPGKMDFYGETGSTPDMHPRQTLSQTVTPVTCHAHSSFLKLLYCPLTGPQNPPLYLLRWYLIPASKPSPRGLIFV